MLNEIKVSGVIGNEEVLVNNVVAAAPKILGLDIANSYVKMFDGEKTTVYPNTSFMLTEKDKDMFLTEMEGRTIPKEKSIYTFTNESGIKNHYQIGLTKDGITTSFTRKDDRYRSEAFKREFLLAVTSVASNGEKFVICTGLPSVDYYKKEVKNDIKSLEGTYTVEVNGSPVTFEIQKIFVELQPRGTYLSSVYQFKNGQLFLKNEELSQAKYVGIVDGGWGTTDYALINAREDELEKYEGVDVAMSDAYKEFVNNMSGEYPTLAKMPLLEIESEYRAYTTVTPGGRDIPQEQLDVEMKRAFSNTANRMWEELKGKVDLDKLNYVILTGGMTLALKDYLKPIVEGEFKKLMVKDAQTANCTGYFIRAFSLLQDQGGNN